MEYTVYTDGGYSIADGIGGSAFVILRHGKKVAEGKYKVRGETSQRAELKAIILAIWKVPAGSRVHIVTDSQYSIKVLARTPKKPKKNLELIARYNELRDARGLTVSFEWTKGHNGDIWNEYCDALCTEAMCQHDEFVYNNFAADNQ